MNNKRKIKNKTKQNKRNGSCHVAQAGLNSQSCMKLQMYTTVTDFINIMKMRLISQRLGTVGTPHVVSLGE
jgi:hypothetical protein